MKCYISHIDLDGEWVTLELVYMPESPDSTFQLHNEAVLVVGDAAKSVKVTQVWYEDRSPWAISDEGIIAQRDVKITVRFLPHHNTEVFKELTTYGHAILMFNQ